MRQFITVPYAPATVWEKGVCAFTLKATFRALTMAQRPAAYSRARLTMVGRAAGSEGGSGRREGERRKERGVRVVKE